MFFADNQYLARFCKRILTSESSARYFSPACVYLFQQADDICDGSFVFSHAGEDEMFLHEQVESPQILCYFPASLHLFAKFYGWAVWLLTYQLLRNMANKCWVSYQ